MKKQSYCDRARITCVQISIVFCTNNFQTTVPIIGNVQFDSINVNLLDSLGADGGIFAEILK